VREHVAVAGGKMVFDKFHIAKHLGEAVDRVRRRENKTLRAAGDDRLTGTRYDWLRHPAAMAPYGYVYERPARKHFRWWHGWAVRSRLQPMIETARMLKRRLENILTYLRHRITNAASESINSKIQWVKHTARGFRNKRNFQTAIYFHCGGLDMAPSFH
jgi:transposase